MEIESFIGHGKEALHFFAIAMVELTILFIGISFLVGVINEFLPQEKVKKILSGRKGRGYFVGAVLGGLTPFCSCSTIPMMVGLLKAGAGFGPTMSFLIASPLVNPILIGLFLTLLGTKVTLIYSILALGLAILSGYVLEISGFSKYIKKDKLEGDTEACCAKPETATIQPLNTIQPHIALNQAEPQMQTAATSCCPPGAAVAVEVSPKPNRWQRMFNEAVKQFRTFLPYIVIGVAIGALIHGFMPADLVARVAGADNPLAIPVSAVIGIPLYIRASTMLPIASSLVAKGMSLGAVIALIIGGAGASLPEVTMLKGLFRWQLLVAFLTAVFLMAITSGFVMNAFLV